MDRRASYSGTAGDVLAARPLSFWPFIIGVIGVLEVPEVREVLEGIALAVAHAEASKTNAIEGFIGKRE